MGHSPTLQPSNFHTSTNRYLYYSIPSKPHGGHVKTVKRKEDNRRNATIFNSHSERHFSFAHDTHRKTRSLELVWWWVVEAFQFEFNQIWAEKKYKKFRVFFACVVDALYAYILAAMRMRTHTNVVMNKCSNANNEFIYDLLYFWLVQKFSDKHEQCLVV